MKNQSIMNAQNIGQTISALRKKAKMTQAALAAELNVSDKTVSKWENGLGYPEISQFPKLAKLFGVSLDYLMTGERVGITLAGNILADIVKNVDCYPQIGMLANITSVSRAVGGAVPNTAIDLAKIDRSVPLSAIGRVGDDEYGRFVTEQMQKYGINTSQVTVSPNAPTSFSDVMNLPSGERTFFHARGSNGEFAPEHINLSAITSSILHIGYILLLDAFDKDDEEYGTVMARFLHSVQGQGIKTSIDVVSDSSADYGKKIIPALKYCDYAIINEIECSGIFRFNPRNGDGSINTNNIRLAMEKMVEAGVKEKVIVHAKEAAFALDASSGAFSSLPSLKIPNNELKGSVGAGDAFCAGSLYSLYNGRSDEELLHFASCAAACNLFAENSVDSMRSKEEIEKLESKYGRLDIKL